MAAPGAPPPRRGTLAGVELPKGTRALIAAFAISGTVHFIRPSLFEPLVPARLGDPRPWVLGSGAAELVCAGGLAARRPWAPAASAATLAAVWVGNWSMALSLQRSAEMPAAAKAAAWARVPLQLPMIAAALRSPTE